MRVNQVRDRTMFGTVGYLTWRVDSVNVNRLIDSALNDASLILQSEVIQQPDRSGQHGHRIRYVLAGNGFAGVASSRLEHGILDDYLCFLFTWHISTCINLKVYLGTDVLSAQQSGTADKTARQV